MAEKEPKNQGFTVSDRRLFSRDGELRQDVAEQEEQRAEREREKQAAQQHENHKREEATAKQEHTDKVVQMPATPATEEDLEQVEPPSAAEQQASADAYKASSQAVDDRIRQEMKRQGQTHRTQDFEITFEKFIVSLYMSALMQLGLAAPQGAQPEVDIIGARQTIDTLGLLQDKTKGNLTAHEETLLQNTLYELRMAYLEVTNLLTSPPQRGAGHSEN